MSALLSLKCQGKICVVMSDDVGLLKKSSSNVGIIGTASGNCSLKNASTSSFVVSFSNDTGPVNGKNRVQVNVPSVFGSAIIIKFLRGQMCRACCSIWILPVASGGMLSSL